MKANVIPGAIVLIKSRDKGTWQATLGTGETARPAPLAMADYVRIGSNTKTMTSTVIIQLCRRGASSNRRSDLEVPPRVPNGQNITIKQLATMRSDSTAIRSIPASTRRSTRIREGMDTG
jgi:D-alanyl-D-alanine carboxypeptidase